jgi:DNA-binding GntR family transcriptional regulator
MAANDLYTCIQDYERERGYCPSQRELAAYFGVSQATICKRLHALSGAGLVVVEGKHRGIALKGRTRRSGAR